MAEYAVQINVKIGDHLVNVTGETTQAAVERVVELSQHADLLHQALSILDGGRPATEIVEKEKKWGARSQGGRTYQGGAQSAPASQPAPTQFPSAGPASAQQSPGQAPAGWNPALAGTPQQFDPHQEIQQQLGAQVISQTPNGFGNCPIHGQPLAYFGPGVSQKSGKPYGARWACQQRGCSSIHWQKDDGTWS